MFAGSFEAPRSSLSIQFGKDKKVCSKPRTVEAVRHTHVITYLSAKPLFRTFVS